jgi:hypothetical protein
MLAQFGMALMTVAFSLPVAAQTDGKSPAVADASNAECVEKLEIPAIPPLARQARLAGTLSVTVTLDGKARVDRITAEADLDNNRARGGLLHASSECDPE